MDRITLDIILEFLFGFFGEVVAEGQLYKSNFFDLIIAHYFYRSRVTLEKLYSFFKIFADDFISILAYWFICINVHCNIFQIIEQSSDDRIHELSHLPNDILLQIQHTFGFLEILLNLTQFIFCLKIHILIDLAIFSAWTCRSKKNQFFIRD